MWLTSFSFLEMFSFVCVSGFRRSLAHAMLGTLMLSHCEINDSGFMRCLTASSLTLLSTHLSMKPDSTCYALFQNTLFQVLFAFLSFTPQKAIARLSFMKYFSENIAELRITVTPLMIGRVFTTETIKNIKSLNKTNTLQTFEDYFCEKFFCDEKKSSTRSFKNC